MRKILLFLAAGVLLPVPSVYAQDKSFGPSNVYRVEINIHDGAAGAGKAGRRYVQLIEANGKGQFRVGNKVPYSTGTTQSNAGATPVITQFNYADVGVSIDTRLREAGDKVQLATDLDLSTIVRNDQGGNGQVLTPTISSLRLSINALLSPGKPAVVASIDDPVTMRKFDVETTVTRVD